MMAATCAKTDCASTFSFDPATTHKSPYVMLSQSASSGTTYYPTCPRCGTQQRVIVPDKEK